MSAHPNMKARQIRDLKKMEAEVRQEESVSGDPSAYWLSLNPTETVESYRTVNNPKEIK